MTDGWKSVVRSQYRRYSSVLFVKDHSACLTSRMSHLGQESRGRAGMRRYLIEQELRGRREDEAYFSVNVRGRGIRRWGFESSIH